MHCAVLLRATLRATKKCQTTDVTLSCNSPATYPTEPSSSSFVGVITSYCVQGRIQKVQRGGGGSILEKGGRKAALQRTFQCFSHKSFVKFSRKKGGRSPYP